MQLDGQNMLVIVRKKFCDDLNSDGEWRYCAVAAFTDFDNAVHAAESMNEKEGVSGIYDVAPLTPTIESWTP